MPSDERRAFTANTVNDESGPSTSTYDFMLRHSIICRVLFVIGAIALYRTAYLIAATIVRIRERGWSENKVRIFAVRVASLTHALGASTGSLYSLLSDRNYMRDPYDYAKDSTQYVFLYSMGYFVYDMADMYVHGEAPHSIEYFCHHSLSLTMFSIVLCTGKLYGFTLTGMLVEISTVFLHLRTMIRLRGYVKQGSPPYNAVIDINMACIIVFRYLTIMYLLCLVLFTVEMKKCVPLMKVYIVCSLIFLAYHSTHITMVLVKKDGFFGYEVERLDEDHIDPLGPVKKKQS